MHRLQRPKDHKLDALLEERDHLKIQISLMHDVQLPDREQIEALKLQLIQLESEIRTFKRNC